MKKILIILLLVTFGARAQFTDDIPKNIPLFDKDALTWGYYFGLNFYDFKIDYKTENEHILSESNPGFQVGLIGNIRLNDNFSLRSEPGVYFTNRRLIFQNFTENKDKIREISSNYVQLPLAIKFNTIRYGNIRPYVIGGIVFSYNVSSWQDSANDNSAGRFRMKKQSWMYEVGAGFEMYLYYFKLTTSVKGIFSLDNELVRDKDPNSPWTSNIESVKTRGVYFNLTFE